MIRSMKVCAVAAIVMGGCAVANAATYSLPDVKFWSSNASSTEVREFGTGTFSIDVTNMKFSDITKDRYKRDQYNYSGVVISFVSSTNKFSIYDSVMLRLTRSTPRFEIVARYKDKNGNVWRDSTRYINFSDEDVSKVDPSDKESFFQAITGGSSKATLWNGKLPTKPDGYVAFDNREMARDFIFSEGSISTVPLPASSLLILSGLAGLAAFRRRAA